MAQEILKQEIVHGVPVIRFYPSPAMKVFAMTAFCDPEMNGKTASEICKSAGISTATYRSFLDYNPHFEEWLEDRRMQLGGKNKKAMLEAIGMEMAMKGEFNFWKPLALREGVIENDRLEVGLELPSSLAAFEGMSNDQLEAIRNSMLSSLRGMEDAGAINLVERAGQWEPENNPAGTSALQPGPMEIPDALGADGECGEQDIHSF